MYIGGRHTHGGGIIGLGTLAVTGSPGLGLVMAAGTTLVVMGLVLIRRGAVARAIADEALPDTWGRGNTA